MKHQPYSIPQHRKDAMTWTNRPELRARLRKTPKCPKCVKHQFRTKADARGFIAMILTPAPQPDDYQIRPYSCPHGNGWHIGHDRTIAELLKRGKKQ